MNGSIVDDLAVVPLRVDPELPQLIDEFKEDSRRMYFYWHAKNYSADKFSVPFLRTEIKARNSHSSLRSKLHYYFKDNPMGVRRLMWEHRISCRKNRQGGLGQIRWLDVHKETYPKDPWW